MVFEKDITSLRSNFLEEIEKINTSKGIEDLKIKYLGRKGYLQSLMMNLKNVAKENKPTFGKLINDLKTEIESSLQKSIDKLFFKEQNEKIQKEQIDVSLPGRSMNFGSDHPITIMKNKMIDIFSQMGFSVQIGPNVDSDYYNFEALNFEANHPARDMQDTFYISKDLLLRTHTSNVQVRVMENNKPPIRIVAPGKCFRNETISARSHVLFHQIEVLYIDEGVNFSDLLNSLDEFFQKLLGKDVKIRVRPSYFPFVEPGMEVDITCFLCSGKGCRICKNTGFLEVCGAGMVHPNVLKYGNIDPEKYSGYAWGLGIERLAMLQYGITDIRDFLNNDMRFLSQFR
jgi:phenylalanyl-tRNA synthetase alpha chain